MTPELNTFLKIFDNLTFDHFEFILAQKIEIGDQYIYLTSFQQISLRNYTFIGLSAALSRQELHFSMLVIIKHLIR